MDMRKWWGGRRREQPAPVARPNLTRIALLEHDLFGVRPTPGTAAAAIVALRRAGTCVEHDATDVTGFGQQPGSRVICVRCGNYLTPTADGGWQIAGTQEGTEP